MSLLRVLILGLFAWLAARLMAGLLRTRPGPGARGGAARDAGSTGAGEPERLVRDPVCGVRIPEGRAIAARIGGEPVHFCSAKCRDAYSAGRAGHA